MKNKALKKSSIILTAVLILLSLSVYGAEPILSPGIEILEKGLEMKKTGVINHEIYFKPSDFEEAIGVNQLEYVTITSLPDSSTGLLKIAGSSVLENQTISRKNLELLRFVPNYNTLSTAQFTFQDAMSGSANIACTLHILPDLNLAPRAVEQNVVTQKNIAVSKFIKAADPENDPLIFEITQVPKNGRVTLIDENAGYFLYMPKGGYTGKDSFTYSVSDLYGNKLKDKEVSIRVEKPLTDIYYDDLQTHWAHNSALRMTSLGLMQPEFKSGKLCFNPDEPVARGDFLAMAMIVTGYENQINPVFSTMFEDDSYIPNNIKSYAEAAMSMGIVSGYPTSSGGYDFGSDRDITRAEAAVILDRLINEPSSSAISTDIFVDAVSVPDWAEGSIGKIVGCGIINGTGYGEILPEEIVTKAQAAEMLSNAIDFAEQNNKEEEQEQEKGEKKSKSFFNLFGLIG